jgi:hypothetical protein
MNTMLAANVVSAYIESHLFLVSILCIVLTVELGIRIYTNRLRYQYRKRQEVLTDESAVEDLTFEYYSKKQRTIFVRTVVFVLAVFLGVSYYDVRAFSFLAVALGALIMTFKETVVSMITYFHILRNYKVGDDVKVGAVRGEILNIRPTVTTILGKEEDSEYNGKVTTVQNYQFVMNPVERQEMKTHSYLLTSLAIPYNSREYKHGFESFMGKVKHFLDELLPYRNMKNVGYYRSYSGSRYKLNYTYDGDARVIIHISFVSKPKRIADRKEKIVQFVETLKKK